MELPVHRWACLVRSVATEGSSWEKYSDLASRTRLSTFILRLPYGLFRWQNCSPWHLSCASSCLASQNACLPSWTSFYHLWLGACCFCLCLLSIDQPQIYLAQLIFGWVWTQFCPYAYSSSLCCQQLEYKHSESRWQLVDPVLILFQEVSSNYRSQHSSCTCYLSFTLH